MNVKIRNKLIEIKYSVFNGLVALLFAVNQGFEMFSEDTGRLTV